LQRILIIVILFSAALKSQGQILDTLKELFKHKYSIDARLESRTSFINNQLTTVSGVRLGVAFQRKLRIGAGVSWLKSYRGGGTNFLNIKSAAKKDFYILTESGAIDTVSKYLKFAYLSYYIDFVFYKTKRWQVSVPIQAGNGLLWFQKDNNYQFKRKDHKYYLFLYEPGISTQFKMFKWLGVGADVGYRFAFQPRKQTGERLSSPSISIKALFWFDQLFYDLFPNSEITKKFGPSYW
jgi:hypothetical protein